MRALQHRQKYQSSLFGLWPIRAPRGRSAQVATTVPPSFDARWTKQPRQCSCSCYPSSPYLTSHRSSTTLIIFFPPFGRASVGPLSDDNQHEAPISTPTLHVGLHPHQFCSIHGCRPVLIFPLRGRSLRVRPGSSTVLVQLACSPCAPSTPLFFSLSRQIIARRPWRVRGSFRPLMLISPLFFSSVFSLDFTISFTCYWCY